MSLRIRSIKPAYWSDSALHTKLTAAERELYIGLWQQADDAGWLRWQVDRVGAELYPFQPVKKRERFIQSAAGRLSTLDPESPHLVIHDCGHAQVPKMPGHQHKSTKPVFTFRNDHEARCFPRTSAPLRVMPGTSPSDREVEGGVVKDGEVRRGSVDEDSQSEFRQRVEPPPGYPVGGGTH